MRISVRRRGVLLAVSLFMLPGLSAAPEWAAETLDELRDYPANERTVRVEAVRKEELRVESDLIRQRIEIKESILDGVESGRVGLFDAAERFLAMDRDRPEIVAMLYPPERLGSEKEIAAQAVIRRMHARRYGGRPLVAGTMAKLHATFESAFGYEPSDD